MLAEATSPQVGKSLSDEAEEKLKALAQQLVLDAGKQLEDSLTTFTADLTAENQRLEEENRILRERLEARGGA